MKHMLTTTKGFGLILLSLALVYGCNVNGSVTKSENVKVLLRGKVFSGETGKEMPNTVITIYQSVRTGDGNYDFRDYGRASTTTNHYGNYQMEGIIRNCNLDETGGTIKAVKYDSSGLYMMYEGSFKCAEKLQTLNLNIRRKSNLRELIIR